MSKTRKVRNAFAGTSRQLRLTPEDGIRRHPDERGVEMRDRGGNKLVDMIDKETGFCTGVRSPLTDDVFPTRMAKPFVPKKGRWSDIGDSGIPENVDGIYVDYEGKRVRTVGMADGPMSRPRVNIKDEKQKMRDAKRAARVAEKDASRKARDERKLSRHAQGCTDVVTTDRPRRTQVASVPRDLCVAYIKSKYGANVKITDEAIRAARTILRKAGVKG